VSIPVQAPAAESAWVEQPGEVSVTTTGRLVVISGPSGSGKTTLVERILTECAAPLALSVSATTRPARPGEREGTHYYFLTPEEFERRRAAGDFLECCQVFGTAHWYGTLRSEVEQRLRGGQWVVLEIDVAGMRQIRQRFPGALTIFVRPRSWEELERRLRQRGTEAEAAIQRRLDVARREWDTAGEYDHEIINDNVDQAVRELCRLIQSGGENKP
jgi:guanylate kinase